ncbi:MAG: VCBS repeat-containing protein [Planctomycetota bacterium]|nr:MAG: VCBS repeat-containing protein [Planctomycetota bacterium]
MGRFSLLTAPCLPHTRRVPFYYLLDPRHYDMNGRRASATGFCVAVLISACTPSAVVAEEPLNFSVRLLTVDANEGCDVADFDGDGRSDVVAGRNWYRNGDWIPRPVRLIEDRNGYARSNGEWAYDVNSDGLPDVVSVDFFDGKVFWYKNPGPAALHQGLLWEPVLLVDSGLTTNEASFLVDLDGDQRPEWISDQWVATNPLVAFSFTQAGKQSGDAAAIRLHPHRIGDSTGHGIGFGDINNDGRNDILVGTGWYECPPDRSLEKPWRYHPAWDIKGPCPIIVADVDGDGINDCVVSEAHGFGIHLWRGRGVDPQGEPRFERELIDDSFSQAHCLHWADITGDGRAELITGKRVRAHNGRDPGGTDPPVMRYYQWDATADRFVGYTINRGEVGTGLQIRTADIDDDGDTDIVVAGKDGTQILFNELQ